MTPGNRVMKKMSHRSKQDVIRVYRSKYRRATRAQRTVYLDQVCELTGYDRKHAIKLLKPQAPRRRRRAGRKKRYGEEIVEPLKNIWLLTDQLCSKRLKHALPLWLPAYEQAHGTLSEQVKEALLTISAAQIDRVLKPFRADARAWRRTGPKPGTLIRAQVPVRCEAWDVNEPGWVEADTVAHCGGSMSGDFIWSLTLTDIQSCWTSQRATWNRGQHGVLEQIKDIEASAPYVLRGFDCDNGGEFLNHALLAYLRERESPLVFTRSRPYRKNDNAHVEQKNWTHVRQLLGYHRLSDPSLVAQINALYKEAWEPLHNFFMPSCKLMSKEKTKDGRWQKVYDLPQTPCDRLLAWPQLPTEKRAWLEQTRAALDPLDLKAQVEELLREILGGKGV